MLKGDNMILTEQELKRLPTHRLVAIKKKCYATKFGSYDGRELPWNYTKEYEMIKEILSTRGHVPRKHEKVVK
jgi:hypothetical protein